LSASLVTEIRLEFLSGAQDIILIRRAHPLCK
jgi:hypothetical protein